VLLSVHVMPVGSLSQVIVPADYAWFLSGSWLDDRESFTGADHVLLPSVTAEKIVGRSNHGYLRLRQNLEPISCEYCPVHSTMVQLALCVSHRRIRRNQIRRVIGN
jgi:hypothetical protein